MSKDSPLHKPQTPYDPSRPAIKARFDLSARPMLPFAVYRPGIHWLEAGCLAYCNSGHLRMDCASGGLSEIPEIGPIEGGQAIPFWGGSRPNASCGQGNA